MQSLRDAPGYAEMEDYYDSDYVPHDLIDRYRELQLERRKKTERWFLGATQAHGPADTTDSAASLRLTAPSLPAATPRTSSSQRSPAAEQRPFGSSLQSSRGRGSTAANSNLDTSGSVSRHGPRTSVALDAIYAARELSHSCTDALSSGGRGRANSPSVRRAAPPSASPGPARAVGTATKTPRPPRTQKQHPKRKKKTKPMTEREEDALMQRDLYDSAAEARRQERFFSESRRLGKPFVPSGSNSGLDMPTRFMLGDCVKMLYRSIIPDWRVASPMVVSTAEDLIAVYFSLEKLQKAQVTALLRYMNTCLLHNAAIREFHLTKVPEGWDVLTDDGYVLYTFRPPWVKKRVFLPDTVNPSHAHLRDGED